MRRAGLRAAFLAAAFLLLAPAAGAVEPGEQLADPAQEARARVISSELRCLVCKNQSIDDSSAALARDLRVLVRERIAAGDDNAAAVAFDTLLGIGAGLSPATYRDFVDQRV